MIRWKQGDYVRLGRAVSEFNKKKKRIETEQNKFYLPDILDYKEIKETIKNRQELNRYINSLKRFQNEGAENLYTTESGELLTQWERKELSYRQRTITRRLNKKLSTFDKEKYPFRNTRTTRYTSTIEKFTKF